MMRELNSISLERMQAIQLLVLDVDGVLTDGKITYSDQGDEIKEFDVQDGAGIKYWHRCGKRTAIISGRSSPVVQRRAFELGIDEVHLDAKDKEPVIRLLSERLSIPLKSIAYMGDDLPDLPPMRLAGLSISVPNAVMDVKEYASGVTVRSGGSGAVRETIEALLKAQGLWSTILSRYLS